MQVKKVSTTSRNLARQQVAFLASEGLTQKRIASTLGYSQSTVSLLLQEASSSINGNAPLLDPRPRFLVSKQERVRVQNSLYVGELELALKKFAEKRKLDFIPKVYLGLTESDNDTWDMRVKMWGQALSPTLIDLIADAQSITLSWGRQLRSLIDGMKLLQHDISSKKQVTVFSSWPPRLSVKPESQDTIYKDHIALETNALAYDLSCLLNTDANLQDTPLHYLPGIDFIPFTTYPFDLSSQVSTDELKNLIKEEEKLLHGTKSALFNIESYKRIFGSYKERTEDCLLKNVDAALLAAGPPGGVKSYALGTDYGGIVADWYATQTVGDIGGVLLPAKSYKKMTPKELLQFQRVKMRWLGLQESDLKHIAKNGKIGTIVGAVGNERVPALIYGIKNNLIRHLFCDHSVAKTLTEKLLELT